MSKGRKEFQPSNILWLVIAAVVVILLVSESKAQHQSNDMNNQTAGDITGGNVAFSGKGSYAIGQGSFDVDINQCMGSVARSFVFGLYGDQKLQQNYWCHAESLFRLHRYEAAAHIWCNKTYLGELYESVESCVADMGEPPAMPEPAPEEPVAADEYEDMHVAQLEEQQERIDELAALITRAPRTEKKTVYQQQPLLNERQRAALEELKE